VGGAAEAGVVGAERHLDHVEQALVDLAPVIRPFAAFSTLIAIRAALFCVATIRLAL
jgi:hypothetical protein